MSSRSGLCLAAAGLVMAVVCLATLFLLRDWKDPEVNTVGDVMTLGIGFGSILFLDLGALLGLIVMVVGLILALKKQSVKPS